MQKLYTEGNVPPIEMLRTCKAIVYDRVESEFVGEATREEGCWTGIFVALDRLVISKRLCFLIRLEGEHYAQIYTECVEPKIFKTKHYCATPIDNGLKFVDPDMVYATKTQAKAGTGEVVKGSEILDNLRQYSIPIVFL